MKSRSSKCHDKEGSIRGQGCNQQRDRRKGSTASAI
jgi:hypothetical protein